MIFSGLPDGNPTPPAVNSPPSTVPNDRLKALLPKDAWGSPILGVLLTALGSLSGLKGGGSSEPLPLPKPRFDIGPTGWKPYKTPPPSSPFSQAFEERNEDRPW